MDPSTLAAASCRRDLATAVFAAVWTILSFIFVDAFPNAAAFFVTLSVSTGTWFVAAGSARRASPPDRRFWIAGLQAFSVIAILIVLSIAVAANFAK